MLRFTRHGFREMLIGSVVLLATAAALGWTFSWLLALIVLPVLIWLFAFFRDPQRRVPQEQHVMVSPADGTVSDITEIEHDEYLGGPAVRIGIFLSIFNVHVNRSPCDGKVIRIQYKRGRFISALRHHEASEQNESNTIVLGAAGSGQSAVGSGEGTGTDSADRRPPKADSETPIAVVKQIVGVLARRIVCDVKVGDVLERGQRYGMIKFGSRTELTIPKWLGPRVTVRVGQSLRGAADVVAELEHGLHAAPRVDSEEYERLAPRETPA